MRVLITGGAGFIGSHLCDQLLARGDWVTVIDNFATARRDNLTLHPHLALFEGTIADAALVNRVFQGGKPDVVVHAAAAYKDPANWQEDIATNIVGTANVVAAARKADVRRVIYFQTALCYGPRPQEQPITLGHRLQPSGSSYAISKTAGEHYLELSGLDYISFRLGNVYGPRNLSGPLPTFYHRLTTGKACVVMDVRRDFLYVNDLVACVMQAIDGLGHRGAYHLAAGCDYAIKDLFHETARALGIVLDKDAAVCPRLPSDPPAIVLDPTKTTRDFQWKATTPLALGVHHTVEYYQTHGIAPRLPQPRDTQDKKAA